MYGVSGSVVVSGASGARTGATDAGEAGAGEAGVTGSGAPACSDEVASRRAALPVRARAIASSHQRSRSGAHGVAGARAPSRRTTRIRLMLGASATASSATDFIGTT